LGWLSSDLAAGIRPLALWIGLPLAIGSAIYTAFLFGQAEGRDLWQSTLLPFHLILQALMVGSGMMLVLDLLMPLSQALSQVALVTFAASLIIDLFVTLAGEFGMPHASEVAAQAAHDISHGKYRRHFWGGSIGLGHALPLLLLLLGWTPAGALAGLCAIAGLYFFEYAFVMAPQDIPNS
jgi:formate-dependent nitrite reductase membrane component NrfD